MYLLVEPNAMLINVFIGCVFCDTAKITMMMTIIIVIIIISQEHIEGNVKAIAYYHIFPFRFACEYFPFSSIGNRQSAD